jgi:hypothetical protein
MKKLATLTLALGATFVFAISLWGADFWQAKLFTDWSDKEVAKLSADSPWAKQVTISMGGGGGGGETGGKGGRSKGGSANTLADDIGPGAGISGGMSQNLTVRWQSALPIKQALLKMKYGAEVGTSPEAKQILANSEPDYVVVVAGLNRGMVRGEAEQIKQAMMGATELVIKGKEPIKPKDFRLVGQGRIDAIFAFPRTNPIVEDDKEVEFVCKVGTITVKQKFRLKDMLFNGKLEL